MFESLNFKELSELKNAITLLRKLLNCTIGNRNRNETATKAKNMIEYGSIHWHKR
jgi:hypothetical protein